SRRGRFGRRRARRGRFGRRRSRRRALSVAYRLVRALLFLLPAETAHRVTFGVLRVALAPRPLRALVRSRLAPDDPALRVDALGLTFDTPVGLAAGFDKDAAGFEQLAALGFGFVEVGTVTPQPQPGNPKPRLFRLKHDRALINRLGFNNRGMEVARARLARKRGEAVIGVNVGRNKATPDEQAVDDYVRAARTLAPLADYVVVNVSSPHTPGLRDLQAVDSLRPLLAAVREAIGEKPLLVKIAPDLAGEDVDAVADLALELRLDGIIATNTTIERADLATPATKIDAIGAGGLSGRPLAARSLDTLRRLRARVGDQVVLVAAGGIEDADEAWSRIEAGATLVQLYTGFVYGGPTAPANIARGLAERARARGYARVQDAVGRSGVPA
ncbi:MAG TPA: quinone-dependent dihydroorotate dehydrogenase, partial [Solirubrobacteraceae bacterium]|nr:quinone-dependent dihydroorotate dehydrogenase [Solirubrobacteraceae bacterium]